jgi:hypothetical protein
VVTLCYTKSKYYCHEASYGVKRLQNRTFLETAFHEILKCMALEAESFIGELLISWVARKLVIVPNNIVKEYRGRRGKTLPTRPVSPWMLLGGRHFRWLYASTKEPPVPNWCVRVYENATLPGIEHRSSSSLPVSLLALEALNEGYWKKLLSREKSKMNWNFLCGKV